MKKFSFRFIPLSTLYALLSTFLFIPSTALALTPNDTFFSQQWYLNKISAPAAWDQTTGTNDVVVAVLDTGFDMDHPDLSANVWLNASEIAGDGIDNEKNGFIDDVHGYDFVGSDSDPRPDKSLPVDQGAAAHATMIAGIIGAVSNNQQGVTGINWQVKMMNVRILDNKGTGDSIKAKKGIEYAVKNGADVINLSFTGFEIDPSFKDALKMAYEAGVVVVAAVGNTKEGGINVDEKPIYPACHGEGEPSDWIIGVAASGKTDVKSDFSNYGALCTDITAPGEQIVGTVYQDSDWAIFAKTYYESGWSGTSMAVPMVAGAAALLRSVYPSLGPSDIESILRLSADPVIATGDALGKVGAGRLNIAKALSVAPSFVAPGLLTSVVSVASEIKMNSLIKLACTTQSDINDPCRAVYFYATDGKRHAFTNDKVFFTWFDNFDAVQEVSSSFLASLSLGKNVTYHPGIKLVKFQSAPTVYAVSKGGVLHPIVSEQIVLSLYGITWNKQIDDISDAFFGNYRFSTSITSPTDYNVLAETQSVTSLNDNF